MPLSGLRVLRIADGLAPSLAALLLADQGADTVHAVHAGGASPLPLLATLARGARILDLDRPGAAAELRGLMREVDVVIDDGTAEIEPREELVHCTLPPFAPDDPRAVAEADEAQLAAASGLFHDAGGGAPVPTALPLCSAFAGIAGAVGIAAALLHRARTGCGQVVEVPRADAAVLALGAQGLLIDGEPAGERPDDPWSGCWRCADGRWVMVCLTAPRFQERFIAAAGVEHWRELGYGDLARNQPGTSLRTSHQEALTALFATRDAADWERVADGAAFPLTMVRTRSEWIGSEPARAAGLIVDDGATVQPGPAVTVEDAGRCVDRQPVAVGQDAPALAGIRVVDLTQVLAGPIVGRTLAELGADVVKINDPNERGPGWSWSEPRYHTDVNRGKATLLLDLKRPEGQAALWSVADGADVIVQNFRPGVAERLGVGGDEIAARLPAAIVGTVSAFGAAGPWCGKPGYESDAQAVTGMCTMGDDEPEFEALTINDYATGLLGAFGVITALVDRERTGRVRRVHASLAATASTLQLPYIARPVGAADAPAPDVAGRLAAARDGWVCLPGGAPHPELGKLARDEAVEQLRRHGIAAQPVRSHREVMEDARAIRRGLSVTRHDAGGAAITTIGPPYRLSRSRVAPGRLVARPGHDAAVVLTGAGMSAEELARLRATGVVAEA